MALCKRSGMSRLRLSLLALAVSLLAVIVGFSLVLLIIAKYVVPASQLQSTLHIECRVKQITVTSLPLLCDQPEAFTTQYRHDNGTTCWVTCVSVIASYRRKGYIYTGNDSGVPDMTPKSGYLTVPQDYDARIELPSVGLNKHRKVYAVHIL